MLQLMELIAEVELLKIKQEDAENACASYYNVQKPTLDEDVELLTSAAAAISSFQSK